MEQSLREENVISTREAAKMLGVSVRSVQLWVESGLLRAWKTAGNHRRIYKDSVDTLIRERQSANSTVLIVEDDNTTQSYYEALFELTTRAVDLVFANNGFEGLVKLGELKPSLLLVDIDMPGMDGIEMIESIQEYESHRALNIAIVTGLNADALADKGPLPQDIPVYTKPLGLDSLKEIIAGTEISASTKV